MKQYKWTVFAILFVALVAPVYASVITETRHVTIDSNSSFATVISAGGESFIPNQTLTTRLRGEFDVVFETYIWGEVYNLVSSNGELLTTIYEYPPETWIKFENVNIFGIDETVGIDLSIPTRLSNQTLEGSDHPCWFPSDPRSLCTGFTNGPLSSLEGMLTDDAISLTGDFPVGFFGAGTTFTINGFFADPAASAGEVPLPPTWLLIAATLFAARRRFS
ncbi:hypothetical protein [Thiosocius teredinicola]|uniref:hypothetical protein n=1 Tax=Thiosocius teredinicola TaxID=1973002 RepID=UPI000990BBB1